MPSPQLIRGGCHRDSRGAVQFVNGFLPRVTDRFYVIHPNRGDVRGWIGHRRDAKWFFPVSGTFLIGLVRPDPWEQPDPELPVHRFTLDADMPAMLSVPPGFYFAMVAETDGAALAVFSTGKIETAKEDDFRLPAEFWKL